MREGLNGSRRLPATGPILLGAMLAASTAAVAAVPPPPRPERIRVDELPLPPTAPSSKPGSCTPAVNPRRTGCIGIGDLESGSFLPDGRSIVAVVDFTGAPAAPDPASIYSGRQTILIRTDGGRFDGGDAWKCLTCGMPPANAQGISADRSYPQAFADGRRLLIGSSILDCGTEMLDGPGCTPDKVRIYPIRLENRADGAGPGGTIRELRLHPDNRHIGFNVFGLNGGRLDQYGYLGRLVFNPSPNNGPPRYELANVNVMFRPDLAERTLTVDPRRPGHLLINRRGIEVGEFRGFTGDGREAFYVGYSFESSNIDVFAVDLRSGGVRRVTEHPEYTDPLDSSADGEWVVVEDTRGTDRQMFAAAMRGVPPITDLVTTSAVSSMRNNHQRRFFQPFLLDRAGDRGSYFGQQLNAGSGTSGSASDPNWNARADPRWSPDGTAIAFWQALVTAPACGGVNPLPCPVSTEPGGRRARIMVARLIDRKPVPRKAPVPAPDSLSWGMPYVPGAPFPRRPILPEGDYTLEGARAGSAAVTIRHTPDHGAIDRVTARYTGYSDDGRTVLNGSEAASETRTTATLSEVHWTSDLTQSGAVTATKRTGKEGFRLKMDVMENVFDATGTLTTTVNGKAYTQPANGS